MEKQKVLLRKTDGGGYEEIGLVTEVRGKNLTLRMPDGTVLTHQRGPEELTPDAGSLLHLLRSASHVVEQALRERPERIFKQIISDSSPKPVTAKQMKEKLTPLPSAVVDSAWIRARAALHDDADVLTSDARMPTYRLVKEARTDLLVLLPASLAAVPREVEPPPPTEEPRVELASPTHASAADQRLADAQPTESPGPRPDKLLERLGPIAGDLGLRSQSDLARRLLAVGLKVSRLAASTQRTLVEGLDLEQRRLLAVACGELKGSLLAEDLATLTTSDYETALRSALQEVAAHPAEARSLTPVMASLMRRAGESHQLSADLLVRVIKALANAPDTQPDIEDSVSLLATYLPTLPAQEVRDLDLLELARAVRHLPFSKSGARSRLVSALHRAAPAEAAARRWWDGATLDQLSDAARGTLGAVLDDHRVAEDTVRPLVHTYLDGVSSRSGVAAVWALPLPLARHVTGNRLVQVLGDVGSRDALTRAWLAHLSNADKMTGLEEQIVVLNAQLDGERASKALLQPELDRLRVDLRRAAEQLAAARNAERGSRQAHDRQIRIDGVRALAVVAAQVTQSGAARGDEALMSRVDHACGREGLRGFGEIGKQVSYQPELYDSLSSGLTAGSAATVVRSGYTWIDGDVSVVLVKGHVVAEEGGTQG